MAVNVIELPLDVQLLPVKILKAGSIECVYENGYLRYLRNGDVELVRMIYIAVRDEHWDTASYSLINETIEQNEKSFTISYTANYSFKRTVYKANVVIYGKENGEISFAMHGEAAEEFISNRIGICVLHPVKECCGRNVDITSPKGEVLNTIFPELISPHQPFLNIASMKWSPSKEIVANLQFKGDIFESEDQRNWTDGSFKTYSTPLSIPFPVNVKVGDSKQQQVILSTHSNINVILNPTSAGERLPESERKIPFPKIAFSRTTSIEFLKDVLIDYYYVNLFTSQHNWHEQWREAVSEARSLKVKIICEVTISKGDDLKPVLEELAVNKDILYSLLFIPGNGKITDGEWISFHANEIENKLPGVLLEYGSNSYFAELNRSRLEDGNVDYVSFPVNPQAHAVDYRTMVDNLESHVDLLKTTQAFMPGKLIRVGPISFTKEELQNTHFAAWWTLMAIGNFAGSGAITIGPNIPALLEIFRQLKKFKPVFVIKNKKKGFDSELIVENEKSDRLVIKLKQN